MRSCDIENNINGVYYILIYISWNWFDKTLSGDIYPFVGQPLIVRSSAREEISRKLPREPHVFPLPLIQQTTNMASSDRFVVAVSEEEILYIISNIFAKPQVFYYLIFDAKIFDIIYQLSPLLECDSTVCLPSKR